MMPVNGAPMGPVPNNPFQGTPRNEGPSTAPPPTAPTAAPATAPSASAAVNETVSESRLKSVAHQEQQRKETDRAAQAKAAPSFASDSAIPDSVAKHMADLKNKAKAVLTPPSTPPAQQVKDVASQMSSEDVVSAFKTAQTNPTGKVGAAIAAATVAAAATATSAAKLIKPSSPATPKPEKTPSQSVDSIQQQLRELDVLEAKSKQQEQLRSQDPTIMKPDIVVVDRKKTLAPEVPDSVAAGRITAESLIESSARRVQGQADDEDLPGNPSASNQIRPNVPSSPVDTSILQKVKAELESPNKIAEASTRTPSITDYARSLEESRSSDELQDPSDSTLPMERRPSNVRPVDIAKSLAEHDSIRGIVDDIRPSETDSESTQIANQRANANTIPAKGVDNSLAGLMREARKSNPEAIRRKADSDVSRADSKPTSKAPEKPPEAPKAKPIEGNLESEAIPQQIQQLSDSISSFARPNGKNAGPKES